MLIRFSPIRKQASDCRPGLSESPGGVSSEEGHTMQFEVRKCPRCQEYLKVPADRSLVLCMYCGNPVPALPAQKPRRSLFIRRSIGIFFLVLMIVMTVLLLISFRVAQLGLRRILNLLGARAPLSRAATPGPPFRTLRSSHPSSVDEVPHSPYH